MSQFYQVVEIEGKGLGCVATKGIKRGTLILREKAQIFDNGNGNFGSKPWIKGLVKSFNEMTKSNQEDQIELLFLSSNGS